MITEQQAQRILITGGRAPVALEWCRLLHAAGHEVYVAESFPQPLCRYSNTVRRCYTVPAPRQQPFAFVQELQRIVDKERIDVLLPTCEEIFHIAGGMERLSASVQVISPTLAELHRLHHKGDFMKLVRAAGLAVPETVLLENAQQWEQTQQRAWEEGKAIVLKPAYSRFASQVWLPPELEQQAERHSELTPELYQETGLEPEVELQLEGEMDSNPERALDVKKMKKSQAAARHANRSDGAKRNSFNAPAPATLSQQQPWIAQQFITGEQLCTYSIVHEGVVVAHATYRCRYRNSRAGASVHFEALERPDTLAWVQTLVSGWSDLEDGNVQQATQRDVQYDTEQAIHRDEQLELEQATRLPHDKRLFHRFSGQLSFDLIEQQHTGTLYPLECNPRATSGVHIFKPEDGLERALLHPAQLVATGTIIQPQPGSRVMLTLPMLVSGLGRRWSRQQWREWRQAFYRAEDAVYRRDDRLPAYGQLRLLWSAWRISRRERISMVEALTYDIEWNGMDAAAERSSI